jgi:hypothetical protein
MTVATGVKIGLTRPVAVLASGLSLQALILLVVSLRQRFSVRRAGA